jgi:hypothetical protein
MVYPSLIAAVSDASHPSCRARSLSVYRFWHDLGYAIGALSAGIIADRFALSAAIVSNAATDVHFRRCRSGVHGGTCGGFVDLAQKASRPAVAAPFISGVIFRLEQLSRSAVIRAARKSPNDSGFASATRPAI